MSWIFWAAALLVFYTYVGYPGYLRLRSRWFPRPVMTAPFFPSISVVMVVRNEAAVLKRKLRNLTQLNYSLERTEILAVSDDSSDDTNSMLQQFAKAAHVRVILRTQPNGKASGINEAMKAATGEIVVFTDARQKIELDAVRLLMENFADPSVGCVSGELKLGDPATGEREDGMGLYWKIERHIRQMEAISASVVGATGALYAVRRALMVELPEETILDDVYIPMHVVRQGSRVVFDPRAQVWDVPDQGRKREFARKVRTLTGNYQLLRLAPWLLRRDNPIRFEFISHKLLRLLVPFALAILFVAAAVLPGAFYRTALLLQLVFYGLSAWALVWPKRGPWARLSDPAFTFVMLNTAAMVAFGKFIAGRKVLWAR